jgi:hypothetical protein
MRNLALGAAVMAMGVAASTPARADSTLYSQPTDFGGAYASQNDTSSGGAGNFATAYDNFTLGTAATVDSVTWVGSYFGSPGSINAFAVSIYDDSSGTPGALEETTNISGNANETFLQTDLSGNPTYSYSAAVTPFSAAAGTQYWLSIVPSTNGEFPQWGWETGTGGDGSGYQVFDGNGSPIFNDLAFSLLGSPNSAVPEPSTLILATLGALGVIGYSRRLRRAAT